MPQQSSDPFAQYRAKDDPFAAYRTTPPTPPQEMSVVEMGRRSAAMTGEGDPTLERLNQTLAPMARPQSVSDVGTLMLAPTNVSQGAAVFGRLMRPAAQALGRGVVRGAAAIGDTVSPDLIGAVSPRIGNAMRVAQRMRDALPAAEGIPALPPTGAHLDLSTPMRPSQMTPQQLAERLQAAQAQGGVVPPPGRAPVYAPRPVPGSVTPPIPLDAPPPAAPAAPPLQVDAASLPESWKPFAERPPAAPPVSHGPATAPKVVGTLRRFSSDLKGQPGPRGTVENISSGVEPGSADAAAMERMHRYDAETVNRYRHMIDNPNGALGLMAGPGAILELIRRRLMGASRDGQ